MPAAAQDTHAIELAIDDAIATVTFNRPEVRNAVNDAMRAELAAVLDRLANDDDVRAVIFTGKGAGFCSGGDIAGMQERLAAPQGDIAFDEEPCSTDSASEGSPGASQTISFVQFDDV